MDFHDLTQALKGLMRTPSFTVPAMLVLALGIGAATAVFSVVDAVLFKPLPFPDADRIVRIWSKNDERAIEFLSVSPADFDDWQRRAPHVAVLAAYERPRQVLLRLGEIEPATVLQAGGTLSRCSGCPRSSVAR